MQKIARWSIPSDVSVLEFKLMSIKARIQNVQLQDIKKKNPKSPKEMTPVELAADTEKRMKLSELFMQQKALENQLAVARQQNHKIPTISQ